MRAKKFNNGNSEFDVDRIVRIVLHARKGRSPYMGIPLQACSPFIVKRELLINALKGINVIEAAIQLPFPGHQGGMAYLQVFGFNEFGKEYMCKFYAQDRYKSRGANYQWATAERKRIGKHIPMVGEGKPSKNERMKVKYELHIRKLEKQLKNLHFIERPNHRILDDGRDQSPGHAGWQEARAREWKLFREQKSKRKLAMRLARGLIKQAKDQRKEIGYYPVDSGHPTLKELYKVARENGLNVRTISQLTTAEKESLQKESYGMVFPYLKRFWEFCGLERKQGAMWQWEFGAREVRGDDFGPWHYKDWIHTLHVKNQLLSEISACRELIKGLDEMKRSDEIAEDVAYV